MLQMELMLCGQAFSYQLKTFLELGETAEARCNADPEASSLSVLLQSSKKMFDIMGKISDAEGDIGSADANLVACDVRETMLRMLKGSDLNESLMIYATKLVDSMKARAGAVVESSKQFGQADGSWKKHLGEDSSWEQVKEAAKTTIDQLNGSAVQKSTQELLQAVVFSS